MTKSGKIIRHLRRSSWCVLISFGIITLFSPIALSTDTPGIVTGTKNLLDAALGWLLILIPVGCGCVIGWHAFCKQLNEGDPAQATTHNRAMKNALVAGAIGMSASGIVKAVLAFYGG